MDRDLADAPLTPTFLAERYWPGIDEARARALVSSLASAGVRHVAVSTEGDWLRPLAAFLRQGRHGR